jgi:hypothetical protein
VGGTFEGAPRVLVHHRGRTGRREYVNPMMYLAHDTEPDIIYVFATKTGPPAHNVFSDLAILGSAPITC